MRILPLFTVLLFLTPLCLRAENDHVTIANKNAAAVVAVNVAKNDGTTFTGTGFILTPDGLIATSRHVTQDSLYSNITFNTGAVSGEAVVVAEAGNVDLALLKIKALHLPVVYLENSDTVLPGQPITVIGNPRRLQNTISSGLISQVRKKADGVVWHQISAPISPSSSGSPVFNAEGKVVSVAFASYSGEGNQNLNFAIPSNYLRQLVQHAGFTLPLHPDEQAEDSNTSSQHPFVAHVKKSWEIVKRLFSRPQKTQTSART